MLPSFVIIGAMKCGTTSLYNYLESHPDLIASHPKETNFFSSDDHFKMGVDWYQARFEGTGKLAFEASPNYTKTSIFPHVASRMHATIPDAKLIYLVRDPVQRVISHYNHSVAAGKVSMPISKFLREKPHVIDTSRYFLQLQAYLKFFRQEKILILQSEQLQAEPESCLKKISEFIGITANFDTDVIKRKYHVSKEKRSPSWLEKKFPSAHKNPVIKKVSKHLLQGRIQTQIAEDISEEDISFVSSQLAGDIENFRASTGLALTNWVV